VAAFVLFSVAACTDFLDGYLARRMNLTSAVGAMLDPIADKAMVVTALVALVGLYGFTLWLTVPVALILLRELLVSGLREYLGDVKLPVTKLAKGKTTVQMVAIGLLLLTSSGFGGEMLLAVGAALLWLAGLLTVLTGWDYMRRGIAHIREREAH
jgi:CDP-diacylglycerol--glycerol-3-phosphate 3-phosphatidyltransferase